MEIEIGRERSKNRALAFEFAFALAKKRRLMLFHNSKRLSVIEQTQLSKLVFARKNCWEVLGQPNLLRLKKAMTWNLLSVRIYWTHSSSLEVVTGTYL